MVKLKGFTLIELMIVVAIITILAVMVIPALPDYKEQNAAVQEYDSSSSSDNTMLINGIEHKCDQFGQCEPGD